MLTINNPTLLLLSLISPSCMIAPIRELVNTLFPSPLNHQSKKNMSSNSLKVVFNDDIDMVTNSIGAMFNLNNNFDEVRDRSLNTSAYKPRSPSVSSSESKEEYYTCVQQESNRMDEDEPDNSPGNVKLEYKTQSQNHQVSKAANSSFNTRQ